MLNCSIILEGTAQLGGDRVAVVTESGNWNYRRLNRAANRLAGGLRAEGVRPGDFVVVACPNRVEFVVAYFGILKAGAVVVPVNVLYRRAELKYVLEDTRARGIIAFEWTDRLALGQEALSAREETERDVRFWGVTRNGELASWAGMPTIEALMARGTDDFDPEPTRPGDPAVVLYTSGTTGKAKGVVLTHQNILTAALTARDLVAMRSDDVSLVGLPLFHCYAQTAQMNAALLCGSSLSLLERFEPERALRLMAAQRVTLFCGVPTMYWSLLQAPAEGAAILDRLSAHLRLGCCGGASMPEAIIREFRERCRIPILEGYGLSETSAMTTFNQLHFEPRIGSVGKPVWGVNVRVVGKDRDPLPAGERGEIEVQGHSVMQGYLNRPELTARKLRDGWLRTGDIGRWDEEGYLYLVDRVDDLIIRGGYNVYPAEVEAVVQTHPAVALAAVVGVAHEKYGQEIVAYVVLREAQEAAPETIVEWTKKRMAGFKYPRQVRIVDSLPLTATGKVRKPELRERIDRAGDGEAPSCGNGTSNEGEA